MRVCLLCNNMLRSAAENVRRTAARLPAVVRAQRMAVAAQLGDNAVPDVQVSSGDPSDWGVPACLQVTREGLPDLQLHPLWLRERCNAPQSAQQGTGQRLFEISDLLGVGVVSAELVECGAKVAVTFSDDHQSTFDMGALLSEADDARAEHVLPPTVVWGAAELPRDEHFVSFEEVGGDAHGVLCGAVSHSAGLEKLTAQLLTHGTAVVRGVPRTESAITEFAESIGPVRSTNFGKVFRVKAEMGANDTSAEDVAYSSLPLALHVDNPYRNPTPGYQLLHCLTPAENGGESLIADGFWAAEELRRSRPDMFRLLATTPLRFSFTDGENRLAEFLPYLCLEPPVCADGSDADPVARRLARVVFSPRLSFAPALPAVELQRWYEAHAAFYSLLHSDECCVTVKLAAGDLLIVDNERVLHGRAGFSTLSDGSMQSKGRWFQGCYIDKDAMKSTYWMLSQQGSDVERLEHQLRVAMERRNFALCAQLQESIDQKRGLAAITSVGITTVGTDGYNNATI